MMSNSWFQVGLALVAGMGVGFLYFSALWITLQRLLGKVSAMHMTGMLVLSYFGRLALVLAVFYWLATLGIGALVVGVTGFTLVALLITASRVRSGA